MIIIQGETGLDLYFLAWGDLEVSIQGIENDSPPIIVKHLVKGDIFGEIALITKNRRSATVKSKNYTTIAALSQEKFTDICNRFPEFYI